MYPQVITLPNVFSGPVVVSNVAVTPATPQTIVNIYYNGNTIQVTFSSDAPVVITIHSSVPPVAVYADSTLLTQAPSTTGLTVTSNAWVYQNQAVTCYADPKSLTLFYTTPSASTASTSASAGIPQSPTSAGISTADIATAIGVLAIIGIAAIVLSGRRKRTP